MWGVCTTNAGNNLLDRSGLEVTPPPLPCQYALSAWTEELEHPAHPPRQKAISVSCESMASDNHPDSICRSEFKLLTTQMSTLSIVSSRFSLLCSRASPSCHHGVSHCYTLDTEGQSLAITIRTCKSRMGGVTSTSNSEPFPCTCQRSIREILARAAATGHSTMRRAAHHSGCAKCGAGAGCSAIKYQSLPKGDRARRHSL